MSRRPIRLLGHGAFLIGSVAFLFGDLWRAGVFAFIVGSCAHLLAELIEPPRRRPSRRAWYRQQELGQGVEPGDHASQRRRIRRQRGP